METFAMPLKWQVLVAVVGFVPVALVDFAAAPVVVAPTVTDVASSIQTLQVDQLMLRARNQAEC